MENKKVGYGQYANNIKKNVIKKREYDTNQIKKTTKNLSLKIVDYVKSEGIKNSIFENRVDKFTQNVYEKLTNAFQKNTNSLLTNLNDVFSNNRKEEIGNDNNDIELKEEIETVLQSYEKDVKKQVEALVVAYKIPQSQADKIIVNVGNSIHTLTNKTILELQDYHKNINGNFLKFVTSQYEEYEKQISEQVAENVTEEKISSLSEQVYTDEELVGNYKNDEENKEVLEVKKEKDNNIEI